MFLLNTFLFAVYSLYQSMTGLQPISEISSCHKGVDWNKEYIIIATEAINYTSSHDPLFEGDLNEDGIENEEDIELGRFYTASLFISISYHESRFIGKNNRGSGGADVCLMQINRLNSFRVASGWTADEIEADYGKCFDLGYKSLQYSFKRGGTVTHRLLDYTSNRKNLAHQRCKTFALIADLPINKWCGI